MGPTAVGKTAVSLHLAKKIGAEIINCDSMQVYKGMDICTSKPSKSIRKKVPHHLFDFISPAGSYNAHKYAAAARKKIEEIIRRKRNPLFIGGSGLYMRAVIDGLFPDNKTDLKLRRSLEKLSIETLFTRLKTLDPDSAKVIDRYNKRRLIRALEVCSAGKEPFSLLKKKAESIEEKYDIKIFVLNMERNVLYERINKRVDKMFKRGLAAEIKRLSFVKLSKTARFAFGIRELSDFFTPLENPVRNLALRNTISNGVKKRSSLTGFNKKISLEEAKRLIKRNTRRYAKRQLTWFRADKRINWLDVSAHDMPQEIADKIIKMAAL